VRWPRSALRARTGWTAKPAVHSTTTPTSWRYRRISGTVVPGGVTIELERTSVIESPYTTHLFSTVHR